MTHNLNPVDFVERLRNRAFRLAARDFNGDGARLATEAAAEIERMRAALEGALSVYVELVESGDAGFWDPEKEDHVISARAALKGPTDDQGC